MSTRHASPRHVVLSTCHTSPRCFFDFFSRVISVSRHTSPFFKRVIKKFPHYKFSALETCLNSDMRSQSWWSNSPLSSTPVGGQPHHLSPGGHLSPLLAVKFTPSRPAVIFHPCLQSNSPVFVQRSSSTPACINFTPLRPAVILHPCLHQLHPSPTSGHPPPLLAVKLTPLGPAVILHPCLRSNSPLSAQRSSSPPDGGQTHPSPPGYWGEG